MAIDFDAMTPAQRKQLEATGYRFDYRKIPLETKRKQQGRGVNQLERDFAAYLAGRLIITYWLKPFILRIGPNTTFEPDFMVFEPREDGIDRTWVIDTKGPHCWEDSRIKIKIAAEKFPMWKFLIVTRPQGVWKAKEISVAHGRGRIVKLPWLQ
jgi:hypothetical protein